MCCVFSWPGEFIRSALGQGKGSMKVFDIEDNLLTFNIFAANKKLK